MQIGNPLFSSGNEIIPSVDTCSQTAEINGQFTFLRTTLQAACKLICYYLQVVNQLWTSVTQGEWRLWSGCVSASALRNLVRITAEKAECKAVEQSPSTQAEREHLSRLTSITVYLPYVVILPGVCRTLIHTSITNFLTHLLLPFRSILFFSLTEFISQGVFHYHKWKILVGYVICKTEDKS